MGLRWPENHQNVENFIGRRPYDKLSCAVKKREFKGKQKHCGSSGGYWPTRRLLQNLNRLGGLGDSLTDYTYFFFSDAWVASLPRPLFYVGLRYNLQASRRHRASGGYRQIGRFRKQRTPCRAACSAKGQKPTRH
jgi:hypothetical protein